MIRTKVLLIPSDSYRRIRLAIASREAHPPSGAELFWQAVRETLSVVLFGRWF